MLELSLNGKPYIALCDLLKVTNLTESGGVAKHLIAEGKVMVNGEVELRKRAKIIPNQIIEYNGKKVKVIE
jgi:ribosome-associated protein